MNGRSHHRTTGGWHPGRVTAAPARTTGVLSLLAALALLAGTGVADPAGRVLLVPAGVLLALLAARDLLLRPVLEADTAGLSVVDGWRRRPLAWSQVEAVRLVTDRRVPLLELDLGRRVVVLSRRRLGRPPTEVVDELTRVWTAARER